MIGMDTPESVAPQEERNCEEGVLASDHMKELVGKGDVLWLQYDTSVTDKYDRPLAYVWRALPASAAEADDPAVIARDMLNAIQVIDGYGQAKTYRPDIYHDGLFAQWGDEALADARGVTHKWA
nr:thermonuclease family protein [Eggerthella hominis]